MSDFFQTGSMATLHMLGAPRVEQMEQELQVFSKERPIALILPCHVNDLETVALKNIIEQLAEVKYIAQVVIGIDGATAHERRRAQYIFGHLPQEVFVLWNDGPEMRKLIHLLAEYDFDLGPSGKGRNMWLCFGYVLASNRARMVAVHDCDILTYSRQLLARLCYPVAHPRFGFDFCKGYSARFTNKLHGRVMRLMFTPLIRSLENMLGAHPFLSYLNTFRYPLAGEVCLDLDIIRRIPMSMDWGIEVGMLAEVFRVTSPKGICQVELSERYDHKHQELSVKDPSKGLNKMAIDIANRVFHSIAGQGIKLDQGLFDTLRNVYVRYAEDTMRFYAADSEINGLRYDRFEEEKAVATFAESIRVAAELYLKNPLKDSKIPDWNYILSAVPNFFEKFREAVKRENGEPQTS